ncbi:hypothetical protein [Virgibacillus phasianinus]|nr:hypothetical protein [Virgibacillus phasianinus]
MQKNQQGKKNSSSKSAGTDIKKVKQEIQEDINSGQGAMTSREAGSMRD